MTVDRKAYADALIDAVGGIDDRLITEAAEYKRKTPGYVKTAIGLAASLLVLSTAMLPLIMRGGRGGYDRLTVASLLGASPYTTVSSVAVVGEPRIIWKYDGEDVYHEITVTLHEAVLLMNESGKGERTVSDTDPFRLWVTDGSGSFVTPYLSMTDGNVGCTVFDYGEEYTLSPEAERIIKAALDTTGGENEK